MSQINYDTHAHIDLYKDVNHNLEYIEERKSYTIVVTNLPALYKRYISQHKNLHYVKFSLGLHPQLAIQYKNQLPLFNELAETSRYIGEVGLDFAKGIIREQLDIFEKIVNVCENYGNKIISVHSRKSAKQVVDIIGKSNNTIILHWFSGTVGELERAIQAGYYFSVNSDMLSTKRGIDLIKRIPPSKLLYESDAPFTRLLKEKYDLQFIDLIVKTTALVLGKTEQEVRIMYADNFKKLLAN